MKGGYMETLLATVQGVISNTVSQDFRIETARLGKMVCYDRIAAADLTHAPTLITLGFVQGASEYLIESFAPAVAGQVVSTQSRIFLPGTYLPFVRIVGGTAADIIKLLVYGYITDMKTLE
jgi:hypothetical protein